MSDQHNQDITRVISIVRRRERVNAGLAWFSVTCLYLALLAVVLAVVDRLGANAWLPWTVLIIVMSAGALLAGLAGWWRSRPDAMQTARRVDDRLQLKDRLSTAIACRDRQDPFARAVVEDAMSIAATPQTREQVRRQFRLVPPPFWWGSPALVLVALVITLFGQWDVFTPGVVEEVDLRQVRADATESVEASVNAVREDPELSEAMAEVLEELDAQTDASFEKKQDEESIRREALKRLTELNRNLENILEGPEGQSMESLKESLESLESSEDSPVSDLMDSLSKGEFDEAQQQLSDLQDKIDSGELSEAERKDIADSMESMADQLDDLASDQQAMRDALRQAGLDPELANDPEALKKALEQAGDLNESQKQKLSEKAEAESEAKEMLKKLSEASQQACEQCRNPSEKKSESGSCKGMSEEIGKMQQKQEMLEKAKDAQGECQSQCNKLGQGLAKQSAVKAAGKNGERGKGDSAGVEQTDTGLVARQDAGKAGDGPIVDRQVVDRDLDIGESSMTLRQAQQAASEGFDEAIDETPLPRQYHDALKHYFSDKDAVEKAIESDAKSREGQKDETSSEETESEASKSANKPAKGASGGEN